jgi:putative nucleotidyltransferase with HDIG domain
MNGRAWKIPLAVSMALFLVVWVNDFFVALVRGGEFGSVGYAVHLAAFAALVALLGYTRYQLTAANRRLAVCRLAWRCGPCAMALVREGRVIEVFGDEELLGLCGLAPGTALAAPAGETRQEEVPGPEGEQRVVERRCVPMEGFEAYGYAAELLCEVSGRVREAAAREGEYVKMLKILVNMFEMKDPYSNGHSEAVSNLAHDLAKELGLSAGGVGTIARAALLHDIGKIIIPAEIINKGGALTAAEYEAVQAHSAVGADILATLGIFREETAIVRHHHERFDGRGYPDCLRGREIPLGARIVAVADAFDAMTSGRSVRGRREVGAALAIIEAEKGGQFDPEVADAFISLVNAARAGKEKETR